MCVAAAQLADASECLFALGRTDDDAPLTRLVGLMERLEQGDVTDPSVREAVDVSASELLAGFETEAEQITEHIERALELVALANTPEASENPWA